MNFKYKVGDKVELKPKNECIELNHQCYNYPPFDDLDNLTITHAMIRFDQCCYFINDIKYYFVEEQWIKPNLKRKIKNILNR